MGIAIVVVEIECDVGSCMLPPRGTQYPENSTVFPGRVVYSADISRWNN
jgi:hypothetical protein